MIVDYAPEHRPALEALLRGVHHESAMAPLALDMEKLVQTLTGAPVRLRLSLIDGVVVGCFAGYVAAPYFSSDLVGYDLGWYVDRERRGGTSGVRLLLDFEAWAKEQGAKTVILAQSTGIAAQGTARLYSRCGYTLVGACAMKGL